jgi:hypothetical protein
MQVAVTEIKVPERTYKEVVREWRKVSRFF